MLEATLPFANAALMARDTALARLPKDSPYRVQPTQVEQYLNLLEHERWTPVERGRALVWLAGGATFQTIKEQIAWLERKVAESPGPSAASSGSPR